MVKTSRANAIVRSLNLAAVFGLCGILLGAMVYEFMLHEPPCPLCLLQRLGMIGLAFGCVMNLRDGVRPRHYGVALFSALFGGAVSIRQTLLHIVPGSPSFGTPVFGLALWVWAFIVFTVAVLGIAVMLLLEDPTAEASGPTSTATVTTAFGLLFLIAVANVIITLRLCGLGPCEG